MILVLCGLLFALQVVRGGNVADAFLFAVALAVAAIPEALSSIVTIVLAFGTQKMAKKGRLSESSRQWKVWAVYRLSVRIRQVP